MTSVDTSVHGLNTRAPAFIPTGTVGLGKARVESRQDSTSTPIMASHTKTKVDVNRQAPKGAGQSSAPAQRETTRQQTPSTPIMASHTKTKVDVNRQAPKGARQTMFALLDEEDDETRTSTAQPAVAVASSSAGSRAPQQQPARQQQQQAARAPTQQQQAARQQQPARALQQQQGGGGQPPQQPPRQAPAAAAAAEVVPTFILGRERHHGACFLGRACVRPGCRGFHECRGGHACPGYVDDASPCMLQHPPRETAKNKPHERKSIDRIVETPTTKTTEVEGEEPLITSFIKREFHFDRLHPFATMAPLDAIRVMSHRPGPYTVENGRMSLCRSALTGVECTNHRCTYVHTLTEDIARITDFVFDAVARANHDATEELKWPNDPAFFGDLAGQPIDFQSLFVALRNAFARNKQFVMDMLQYAKSSTVEDRWFTEPLAEDFLPMITVWQNINDAVVAANRYTRNKTSAAILSIVAKNPRLVDGIIRLFREDNEYCPRELFVAGLLTRNHLCEANQKDAKRNRFGFACDNGTRCHFGVHVSPADPTPCRGLICVQHLIGAACECDYTRAQASWDQLFADRNNAKQEMERIKTEIRGLETVLGATRSADNTIVKACARLRMYLYDLAHPNTTRLEVYETALKNKGSIVESLATVNPQVVAQIRTFNEQLKQLQARLTECEYRMSRIADPIHTVGQVIRNIVDVVVTRQRQVATISDAEHERNMRESAQRSEEFAAAHRAREEARQAQEQEKRAVRIGRAKDRLLEMKAALEADQSPDTIRTFGRFARVVMELANVGDDYALTIPFDAKKLAMYKAFIYISDQTDKTLTWKQFVQRAFVKMVPYFKMRQIETSHLDEDSVAEMPEHLTEDEMRHEDYADFWKQVMDITVWTDNELVDEQLRSILERLPAFRTTYKNLFREFGVARRRNSSLLFTEWIRGDATLSRVFDLITSEHFARFSISLDAVRLFVKLEEDFGAGFVLPFERFIQFTHWDNITDSARFTTCRLLGLNPQCVHADGVDVRVKVVDQASLEIKERLSWAKYLRAVGEAFLFARQMLSVRIDIVQDLAVNVFVDPLNTIGWFKMLQSRVNIAVKNVGSVSIKNFVEMTKQDNLEKFISEEARGYHTVGSNLGACGFDASSMQSILCLTGSSCSGMLTAPESSTALVLSMGRSKSNIVALPTNKPRESAFDDIVFVDEETLEDVDPTTFLVDETKIKAYIAEAEAEEAKPQPVVANKSRHEVMLAIEAAPMSEEFANRKEADEFLLTTFTEEAIAARQLALVPAEPTRQVIIRKEEKPEEKRIDTHCALGLASVRREFVSASSAAAKESDAYDAYMQKHAKHFEAAAAEARALIDVDEEERLAEQSDCRISNTTNAWIPKSEKARLIADAVNKLPRRTLNAVLQVLGMASVEPAPAPTPMPTPTPMPAPTTTTVVVEQEPVSELVRKGRENTAALLKKEAERKAAQKAKADRKQAEKAAVEARRRGAELAKRPVVAKAAQKTPDEYVEELKSYITRYPKDALYAVNEMTERLRTLIVNAINGAHFGSDETRLVNFRAWFAQQTVNECLQKTVNNEIASVLRVAKDSKRAADMQAAIQQFALAKAALRTAENAVRENEELVKKGVSQAIRDRAARQTATLKTQVVTVRGQVQAARREVERLEAEDTRIRQSSISTCIAASSETASADQRKKGRMTKRSSRAENSERDQTDTVVVVEDDE